MDWFDREEEHLAQDLNNGMLSKAEYLRAIRGLRMERQDAAADIATEAYNNYMDR